MKTWQVYLFTAAFCSITITMMVILLVLTACMSQGEMPDDVERLAFCKEKGWQKETYILSWTPCCKADQFLCYNDSIIYPDGGLQTTSRISCQNLNTWRCYYGWRNNE